MSNSDHLRFVRAKRLSPKLAFPPLSATLATVLGLWGPACGVMVRWAIGVLGPPRFHRFARGFVASNILALAGCGDDTTAEPQGGGDSGGEAPGGTAATMTTGISACTPGDIEACYEGPPASESIGVCASGTRTCDAARSGFGSCVGQVLPSLEACGTPDDDDCDGQVNEEGAELSGQSFLQ